MDEKDQKEGTESCCSKKKCCGCKALAAVALLLLGGVGGYLAGRHCAVCAPQAVSAPAQK